MTPAQAQEMVHLAHRFTSLASEASAHSVALNALITAYAGIAVSHPCCRQAAGMSAHAIANALLAADGAPSTTH